MPTVSKSIHIQAPIEQVYAFWQNYERFAELLPSVQHIERIGQHKSHWVVRAPFNTMVEFDATTVEDRPNEYVRWESTHGAGTDVVSSRGELTFEPADGGTTVQLSFTYEIPSAAAQRVVSTLSALGYPQRDFDESLATIKRTIEQG